MAIADPIEACRFWLHDTGASPTFTDPQIQEFLDLEKVMDADFYQPSDTDNWTPTYDVIRAAGRGWMWLGGTLGNKAISYKVGDIQVIVDKQYCLNRARELMGAACTGMQRRDEQTEADILGRYRSE